MLADVLPPKWSVKLQMKAPIRKGKESSASEEEIISVGDEDGVVVEPAIADCIVVESLQFSFSIFANPECLVTP